MQKTVLSVLGTRPEAIKMCPLLKELGKARGIRSLLCTSGQHRAPLYEVLSFFSVEMDYDLAVSRTDASLLSLTQAVLCGCGSLYAQIKPDLVLVHGDTATAQAAAQAAFLCGIPVGHVEAGLRTYNPVSPYPEEFCRRSIDLVSSLCFAPTEKAKENLLTERIPAASIFVTGNTGIDALSYTVKADYRGQLLAWTQGHPFVLVSAHRRENWGAPLSRICAALRRLCEEQPALRFLFPLHPNPALQKTVREALADCENLRLCTPLGVGDFHNLLARCAFVMSDSGGIQEEASALGKRVLVLRESTERPEGTQTGALRLVGTDPDRICDAVHALLAEKAWCQKKSPFGDGHASERITAIITAFLEQGA